jgi:hypothetical protein
MRGVPREIETEFWARERREERRAEGGLAYSRMKRRDSWVGGMGCQMKLIFSAGLASNRGD